jgi:hypothetical protein
MLPKTIHTSSRSHIDIDIDSQENSTSTLLARSRLNNEAVAPWLHHDIMRVLLLLRTSVLMRMTQSAAGVSPRAAVR